MARTLDLIRWLPLFHRMEPRGDGTGSDTSLWKNTAKLVRTSRVKPVQTALYAYKTPGFTQCINKAVRRL
jgi:hypothetical protein